MAGIFLQDVDAGYVELNSMAQKLRELLVKGGRGRPETLSLERVSLSLGPGESLAVLGDEQSGKGALLDLIARRLRPVRGRGRIQGRLAVAEPPERMLHTASTVRENIMLYGRLRGYSRGALENRMDGVLWMAEAGALRDKPVRDCEAAARSKLCFALAMAFDPEILLVGVPLKGLGPTFEKRCRARMKTLLGGGAIVVDAACARAEARSFFQKALMLENGRVLAFGPAEEVLPAIARGEMLRLARAESAQALSPDLSGAQNRPVREETVAALLAALYRLTDEARRQKEREARLKEDPASASRSDRRGRHKLEDEPPDGR